MKTFNAITKNAWRIVGRRRLPVFSYKRPRYSPATNEIVTSFQFQFLEWMDFASLRMCAIPKSVLEMSILTEGLIESELKR